MPKKFPPYIKEKAIQLRIEKQMTVPDIAHHLKIAKSTIYEWLLAYPLKDRTKKQTQAQINGTRTMQAKYKKKRDDAYNMGWKEAPELLKDPFFRDFVNMYLAEGFRKTKNEVSIGNSNYKIMLMCQYFVIKYGNPDNRLEYRIQIHADQDEQEIRAYWGDKMSILPESITLQRKSNSGQLSGRNFRSEYGVLTMRASDTYFRSRLQGWMDYLQKLWLDKFNH